MLAVRQRWALFYPYGATHSNQTQPHDQMLLNGPPRSSSSLLRSWMAVCGKRVFFHPVRRLFPILPVQAASKWRCSVAAKTLQTKASNLESVNQERVSDL